MKLSDTCTISSLIWTQWSDPATFGAELTYIKLQAVVKIGGKKKVIKVQRSISPSLGMASRRDPVSLTRDIIKSQWLTKLGEELFADD